MNIKTKIHKELKAEVRRLESIGAEHRSGLVKTGVLALVALVAISMGESFHVGDEKKRGEQVNKEAIIAKSITFDAAEKNETVRMPVKFDDGLRATATTSF